MIDPPLLLRPLPPSLLCVTCWVGGEDSGGLVVWTRLSQRISDTEGDDLLAYRMMPPELKAGGGRLVLDGGGRLGSKRGPPT